MENNALDRLTSENETGINKKELSRGKSKRIVFLEALRIFACFWVIYNHTNGFGIYTEVSVGTIQYYIYLAVSLICKTAVPLFFMISGAILIGKDESFHQIYNRIRKAIIQIILINLLYILYRLIRYNDPKDISSILSLIYSGSGLSAHLWYMYAYLAYIIILPILNIISKHFNEKLLIYIATIIFIYKMIEVFQYFVLGNKIRISPYLEPSWLMNDIFIYPLVGHLYVKKMGTIDHKHIIVSSIIGLIAIVIPIIENVILVGMNGGTYDGVSAQTFHNKFVLFLAIPIFIWAKWLSQIIGKHISRIRVKEIISSIILYIGGTTFGIYIIHIMVKDYYGIKELPNNMTRMGINGMIANLLFVTIVFLCSFVLIAICKNCKKIFLMLISGA